jgi:hypothetical protein
MNTRPVSLCVVLDGALEIVPPPHDRFFGADLPLRNTEELKAEGALLRLRIALASRATDWSTTWARAREAWVRQELDARARRLRGRRPR